MPLEEHDWEILSRRLDGDLTDAEETELSGRISREPELKSALDELTAGQRATNSLWPSLEPSQLEADVLTKCAISNARRRRVSWWPRIAAIAACLLISFCAGWLVRARQPGGVAHLQPTTSNPQSPYRVALTDEQGHVAAVQDFDSADEAKRFAHDVMQWQDLNAKVQHGSPIVLADRL